MKKVIIALSGIIIAAFVVILITSAQNAKQESNKAGTEISKDCSKCPATSACAKMKYGTASEAKSCDSTKCKEKSSDPATCKEGKSSHEGCKTACTSTAAGDAKPCDMAKKKCCTK
jgi:hypothetical protein